MPKINNKKQNQLNLRIHDKDINKSSLLHFSFKYFDSNTIKAGCNKFSIINRDNQYFIKLLDRLKQICLLDITEFRKGDTNKSLRSHQIDWKQTTEQHGFPCFYNNEQLKGSQSYQFSVSGNEHGRVHGFLIDNIFHIVWLDPNHELYAK